MKKLFIGLLAALSLCANAATLLPVQLLNPAGSTSGQAIVSTGASSAPGWSNAVTITGGTINNSTVGIATPLAGKFTTLQATSTITPAYPSGIVGNVTGSNVTAGSVGETISSQVVAGSAISLTSGSTANVTSISLTAGDWDVSGQVSFTAGATTSISYIAGAASIVTASLNGSGFILAAPSPSITTTSASAVPTIRVNVSSTTTVFLVALSQFSTSTMSAYGFIVARRR